MGAYLANMPKIQFVYFTDILITTRRALINRPVLFIEMFDIFLLVAKGLWLTHIAVAFFECCC